MRGAHRSCPTDERGQLISRSSTLRASAFAFRSFLGHLAQTARGPWIVLTWTRATIAPADHVYERLVVGGDDVSGRFLRISPREIEDWAGQVSMGGDRRAAGGGELTVQR
jgi:hypothetical protein